MTSAMQFYHSAESMLLWLLTDLTTIQNESEIAHVSSTQIQDANSKPIGEHSYGLSETWKLYAKNWLRGLIST